MRVTLIPAAGQSSRMRGGDKTLEPLDGAPALVTLAKRALEASDQVRCTLPDADHPRARVLSDLPVEQIYVPNAALGMSESLKAGVSNLQTGISGLMILLADMPEISVADMNLAWQLYETASPPALQCTTEDGALGHPSIFAPQMLEKFAQLSGDRGASKLLGELGDDLLRCPLPGSRARLDLDTPEDWANWRASRV